MSQDGLHYLTIAEAAGLIRDKKLSPVELIEALLARIEQVEPRVRAYALLLAEHARAQAKVAEAEIQRGQYRGPLHGIPICLKDVVYTKGVVTAMGSKVLEDFVPAESATVVNKLEEAGAIILGKSVTHEFAWGVISPPTRNPWNLDAVVGGSSGGSGAALAAGECLGAVGTDCGCSIRNPAAINGIVGLRVTQGRVSVRGVGNLSYSMDTVGPMARSAKDCALMLNGMAGWDPEDVLSANAPVPDFAEGIEGGVKGLTVGVPRSYFFEKIHAPIKEAVEAAIRMLEGLGARVKEIAIPTAPYAIPCFMAIVVPESSSNHERWLKHRADEYGMDVRLFVELGQLYLAKDYIKAQKVRNLIRKDFAKALGEVDVLITPTSPCVAQKAGPGINIPVTYDGYEEDVLWSYCRYTIPISMAGMPTVAVPCGFSEGLPMGMQIVGRAFDEQTVLRVAYAYESATEWHKKRPPI